MNAAELQKAPIASLLFHKENRLRSIEDARLLDALGSGTLDLALSCGTWPEELSLEQLVGSNNPAIPAHLLKQVTEIFIGPSRAQDSGQECIQGPETLTADWFAFFPNLRELHLWNLPGLKTVEDVPHGVETLDFTGCEELASLVFPINSLERLETLDLKHCVSLRRFPWPKEPLLSLLYLYLEGCRDLPVERMLPLLSSCPSLRELDLIEMPQIGELRGEHLTKTLHRLRMNGCRNLTTLPELLGHERLYRLDLKGCERLEILPVLPEAGGVKTNTPPTGVDYLDLSGTRSLKSLPEAARRGRTLFLHGSGILEPPASEHGLPGENVAERTRAYFEDIEVFGPGTVHRCKVLFLGNGGAGKTCLCKALIPGEDPAQDEGSTHGVQFWDYSPLMASGGKAKQAVQVQFWDFGGQEIYHNAHQLFMAVGSVFVLLWSPEQEGKTKERDREGYVDRLHPLHYWLDLIHEACPHSPRILLVCSRHEGKTSALQEALRQQIPDKYRALFESDATWFCIESPDRRGELEAFRGKLEENIQTVVETQGTAVPAHWELAQHMVESWFQTVGKGGEKKLYQSMVKTLSAEEFWVKLKDTLRRCAKAAPSAHQRMAKEIIKAGLKKLDEGDRRNRTLEFLTHSGWVFWSKSLDREWVIVDQKWALDGIYAALDRRPSAGVYHWLRRKGGRFTKGELAEKVWQQGGAGIQYTPEEQDLMISFMLRMGIVFTLTMREWMQTPAPLYVSVAHLPVFASITGGMTDFPPSLRAPGRIAERTIRRAFHWGHWCRILAELGARYGAQAHFAMDVFAYRNPEGQAILLRWHRQTILPGPDSYAGHVEIHVEDSPPTGGGRERVEALAAFVESCIGDNSDPPRDSARAGGASIYAPAGAVSEKLRVYISYAWGAENQSGEMEGLPVKYEEPVKEIVNGLEDSRRFTPVYNRPDLRESYQIERSIREIETCPYFITVQSDKYWESLLCMYELHLALKNLGHPDFGDAHIVSVTHLNYPGRDRASRERMIEDWKRKLCLPTRPPQALPEALTHIQVDEEKLFASIQYYLTTKAPALHAMRGRVIPWDEHDPGACVRRILDCLPAPLADEAPKKGSEATAQGTSSSISTLQGGDSGGDVRHFACPEMPGMHRPNIDERDGEDDESVRGKGGSMVKRSVVAPEQMSENVFRRLGDTGAAWKIKFELGAVFTVKHSKGMTYIHELLARHDHYSTVQELYQIENPPPPEAIRNEKFTEEGLNIISGSRRPQGPSIDAELRKRLRRIQDELSEPQTLDEDREKFEKEREAILATLKAQSCEPKEVKGPRQAVCAAIDRAIDEIGKHEEGLDLAEHLRAAIKKGATCLYSGVFNWTTR